MSLEERAILEAGMEWEAERADSETGAPAQNNVLDLKQMAELGAEVS